MSAHPSWADLVERSEDPQIASHLDSCASCRAEARLVNGLGLSPSTLPGIDSARKAMSEARQRAGEALSRSVPTSEEPADELLPGTRVDRYVVEARLGRGGMGTVYRVVHTQLGSTHALKVLHRTTASERARLIREGQAQSALRHPNVVRVNDVVEVDGAPGLISELVEGQSMHAWFAERGRPSVEQIDAIGLGILRGMAAAHRAGLVHRDLKPANVLLAPSDEGGFVPKVTDFGLARRLGGEGEAPLTRPGTPLGTPAYMAPEQIRDASVADARSDVFSLGAVLYELVTGSRAFGGIEVIEVYDAVRAGRYPPIRSREVPPRMVDAITRALRTDPAERFADAGQLLDAWRGAPVPPPARRRPRWPWAAIPAVGAAALIGGVALIQRTEAPEAPAGPLVERRATAVSEDLQIYSLAMSPDGGRLAYADSRGVWLKPVGERSSTRLLGPGAYHGVDFFPDGQRILVAGRRGDQDGVWSVDAEGSDVRSLLPSSGRAVRLSPEGDRLALMDSAGLWVVSLADGHRTRLRPLASADSTSDLAWSPSGRFVAAVHQSSTGGPPWLEVTAADGSSTRRLLEDPGLLSLSLAPMTWVAPDRLVFALTRYPSGPEVSLYALDGAETAADASSKVLLHQWSGLFVTRLRAPFEGGALAYTRVTSRGSVRLLSLDGGSASPSRLPSGDWDDAPVGWLDDTHVLVVSEEPDTVLYAQALDGARAVPIPAPGIDRMKPVEVLDQALLYWTWRSSSGEKELALMRAPRDGGPATRLLGLPRGRGRQELTLVRCRAGRCLLSEATSDGLELSWLDPTSGERGPPVYSAPLTSRTLAWDLAPDGRHLAMVRVDPGRVTVVDLDGGPSREWPLPLNVAPHVAWSPAGDRLFVAGLDETTDQPYRLLSIDLDGLVRVLWSSMAWYLYAPVPSPDGKSLAVGVYAFDDDVWVAEDLLSRRGSLVAAGR